MYWDTNREHVIEQALSIVLIILLIKRKLAPSHSLLCQCLLYCRVHSFYINVRFSTTLSFRLRFVNSDSRRPRSTFFINAHSIVVPILFLISVFIFAVPSLLHQHHCISACLFIFIYVRFVCGALPSSSTPSFVSAAIVLFICVASTVLRFMCGAFHQHFCAIPYAFCVHLRFVCVCVSSTLVCVWVANIES